MFNRTGVKHRKLGEVNFIHSLQCIQSQHDKKPKEWEGRQRHAESTLHWICVLYSYYSMQWTAWLMEYFRMSQTPRFTLLFATGCFFSSKMPKEVHLERTQAGEWKMETSHSTILTAFQDGAIQAVISCLWQGTHSSFFPFNSLKEPFNSQMCVSVIQNWTTFSWYSSCSILLLEKPSSDFYPTPTCS